MKLSVSATLVVCIGTSLFAASPKPNFVVINIDDLGYAEIGPYGSTQATPHLDRMAREGMKLTSHYAAPVCSPSRAALMTGCYPKRVLPIGGVLFPSAAVGVSPDEVTVAEVLKSAGYATACIGKWHLGDQPEFLPTNQGFDEYFGIPYSNDMGTIEDGSKSSLGDPLPKRKETTTKPFEEDSDDVGIRGNDQPPLPMVDNHKVIARVDAVGQQRFTRQYTERAVKFIRDHQKEPFFLYLPHSAVHFPLYPSPEYVGKSGGGLYDDWTLEIDWSVGQVLDTLRSLGLDKNTLVIFTSDNGGPTKSKEVSNAPLRGSKGTTLEGGMRVCTLAWWPGKVPADSSTAAITSMMDVLPTFAHLADAELPKAKIDGVDQSSVLLGEKGTPPRDTMHYFHGLKLEAVRKGDWKLHLASGELYHLGRDIGEASDVAKQNPDVVRELRELAEAMDSDLGNKSIGPSVRPIGRVSNPQPLIAKDGTIRPGYE